MKSLTATIVALATVLALPALAAPAKHRSPAAQAGMAAYGQATNGQFSNGRYSARDRDVVTFGNRVIGQDPDPNIRTQMRHDPVPSDY
jgi:hypothetical protein